MGGKQADRAAKKKAVKEEEDNTPDAAGVLDPGAMLTVAKKLILDSVLVKLAPKIPDVVKGTEKAPAPTADSAPETTNEDYEGDAIKKEATTTEPPAPDAIFGDLIARLPFYNALGLGLPASGDDAKTQWLAFKGLEFDGGPRPRKKGNPGLERILANLQNNVAQYLHVVLLLMMLRALLFRSFFACLPWLVGYQVLSLMLPLEWPEFPQIPPVEVKFRVAATVGIHALMWLFFLFEAVYKTYFIEKLLVCGLIAGHAYVVAPLV